LLHFRRFLWYFGKQPETPKNKKPLQGNGFKEMETIWNCCSRRERDTTLHYVNQ